LFHTVPLDWHQVFAIGAVASLVLWTEELRKLIARKRSARHRNERHVAHGAAVGS
jgi:hypothetical protein